MAVIYLRHPQHGAKVAVSEMEVENDLQNGWEEFDPTDVVSAPAAAPVEDAAPPASEPINALQPRRRGRRPREATQ